MRPYRIQLSGVTLLLLMCWGTFITPLQSAAQTCSGTLGSITYDTVVNSTTTGASPVGHNYPFSVPQFPISPLSLYAVSIKSAVTVSASVQVLNTTGSTASPSVQIFRSDGFSSSVTGSFSNSIVSNPPVIGDPLGSFATETVSMPNAVNNQTIVNDSLIGSLNGFSGSGKVDFTYTSSNIPLPTGMYSPSLTVTDQVYFSITYYYCNPGVLATDILTFTATRESDQTISLNWINVNEQAGREYFAEVSHDGNSFASFASLPSDPLNSDASYIQAYTINPADKGKLYFRVKLVNTSGLVTYSPLRIIDLGAGGVSGFSIYPNPPSGFLNLLFPSTTQGWQADILAADGSLVQRNYYNNTNSGRLNFQRVLSAGTYFVRATDLQTAKSYVASFVIH